LSAPGGGGVNPDVHASDEEERIRAQFVAYLEELRKIQYELDKLNRENPIKKFGYEGQKQIKELKDEFVKLQNQIRSTNFSSDQLDRLSKVTSKLQDSFNEFDKDARSLATALQMFSTVANNVSNTVSGLNTVFQNGLNVLYGYAQQQLAVYNAAIDQISATNQLAQAHALYNLTVQRFGMGSSQQIAAYSALKYAQLGQVAAIQNLNQQWLSLQYAPTQALGGMLSGFGQMANALNTLADAMLGFSGVILGLLVGIGKLISGIMGIGGAAVEASSAMGGLTQQASSMGGIASSSGGLSGAFGNLFGGTTTQTVQTQSISLAGLPANLTVSFTSDSKNLFDQLYKALSGGSFLQTFTNLFTNNANILSSGMQSLAGALNSFLTITLMPGLNQTPPIAQQGIQMPIAGQTVTTIQQQEQQRYGVQLYGLGDILTQALPQAISQGALPLITLAAPFLLGKIISEVIQKVFGGGGFGGGFPWFPWPPGGGGGGSPPSGEEPPSGESPGGGIPDIGGLFGDIAIAINGLLSQIGALKTFFNEIATPFEGFEGIIKPIFDNIGNAISGFLNEIGALKAFLDNIQSPFQSLINWFGSLKLSFNNIQVLLTVFNNGLNILDTSLNTIKGTLGNVITGIQGFATVLYTQFINTFNQLGTLFSNAFKDISSGLTNNLGTISALLSGIGAATIALFSKTGDQITNIFGAIGGASDGLTNIMDTTASAIKGVGTVSSDTIPNISALGSALADTGSWFSKLTPILDAVSKISIPLAIGFGAYNIYSQYTGKGAIYQATNLVQQTPNAASILNLLTTGIQTAFGVAQPLFSSQTLQGIQQLEQMATSGPINISSLQQLGYSILQTFGLAAINMNNYRQVITYVNQQLQQGQITQQQYNNVINALAQLLSNTGVDVIGFSNQLQALDLAMNQLQQGVPLSSQVLTTLQNTLQQLNQAGIISNSTYNQLIQSITQTQQALLVNTGWKNLINDVQISSDQAAALQQRFTDLYNSGQITGTTFEQLITILQTATSGSSAATTAFDDLNNGLTNLTNNMPLTANQANILTAYFNNLANAGIISNKALQQLLATIQQLEGQQPPTTPPPTTTPGGTTTTTGLGWMGYNLPPPPAPTPIGGRPTPQQSGGIIVGERGPELILGTQVTKALTSAQDNLIAKIISGNVDALLPRQPELPTLMPLLIMPIREQSEQPPINVLLPHQPELPTLPLPITPIETQITKALTSAQDNFIAKIISDNINALLPRQPKLPTLTSLPITPIREPLELPTIHEPPELPTIHEQPEQPPIIVMPLPITPKLELTHELPTIQERPERPTLLPLSIMPKREEPLPEQPPINFPPITINVNVSQDIDLIKLRTEIQNTIMNVFKTVLRTRGAY